MSNLILLLCLLGGLLFGLFSKSDFGRLAHKLLILTILVLIFFMGARLGFTPDLGQRIISYGYSAALITAFSIIFSILTTALIMKIVTRKRGGVE